MITYIQIRKSNNGWEDDILIWDKLVRWRQPVTPTKLTP